METKEQMELRLQGSTSFRNIPSGNEMYNDIMTSLDDTLNIWTATPDDTWPLASSNHKHYGKVMMLYKLINKRKYGSAKKVIGRIIDRIQRNGISYVIPKSDMLIMNKYYKLYKKD